MKKIFLLLSAAALWNCSDYAADWEEKYGNAFSEAENSTPTPSNTAPSYTVCEEGQTNSVGDGNCTQDLLCVEDAWVPVGDLRCETSTVVEKTDSEPEYKMVSTSTISGANYGCSKAMFCGKSGNTRVKTGFDDGTNTYGYWFYYGDASSSFSWTYGGTPSTFVEKSVMPYGGIKGKATLGEGEDAYLGLGFNVAGETGKGVDISSWNGLCVIYQSTAPFFLSLVDASNGALTDYNDFKAALPKGNKANTAYLANIKWSDFYQEAGWGKVASITDVLSSVSQIAFKFKYVTSLTNTFAIVAIGKYGTCKQ